MSPAAEATPLPGLSKSYSIPVILTTDGALGFSTNGFGFNVAGTAGQQFVLERSTDLQQRAPFATNCLTTLPLHVQDPNPVTQDPRFYRARLQ